MGVRKLSAPATILIVALFAAESVSASRQLLQSCVSQANTAAQGPCQSFVASQSQFPPGNATDAELQAYVNTHGGPSQACCVVAGQLVGERCQCDATVQQFAGVYNLTPSSLITFARTAKLACGPAYISADVDPACSSPAPGR